MTSWCEGSIKQAGKSQIVCSMFVPMSEPPDLDTDLLNYPWVVIRFRCHYCERGGEARLAACVAKYGTAATLEELRMRFAAGCPWSPSATYKPRKYGMKCGAYLPDIGRNSPPDLPPALSGLHVISGGRDYQLPAEPVKRPRRRRVGGENP
jgi:hypothetical protein